jgi:hypothetical protein
VPQPKPKPVHVPVRKHPRGGGGGLVIEQPPAAPATRVSAPAEPTHVAEPRPSATPEPKPEPRAKPEPKPAPVAHASRPATPEARQPLFTPMSLLFPPIAQPMARAFETGPLVLSIAPGLVAALFALVTAFTRGRRRVPVVASAIPPAKVMPLRRAA